MKSKVGLVTNFKFVALAKKLGLALKKIAYCKMSGKIVKCTLEIDLSNIKRSD